MPEHEPTERPAAACLRDGDWGPKETSLPLVVDRMAECANPRRRREDGRGVR